MEYIIIMNLLRNKIGGWFTWKREFELAFSILKVSKFNDDGIVGHFIQFSNKQTLR